MAAGRQAALDTVAGILEELEMAAVGVLDAKGAEFEIAWICVDTARLVTGRASAIIRNNSLLIDSIY